MELMKLMRGRERERGREGEREREKGIYIDIGRQIDKYVDIQSEQDGSEM